MPQPRDERGRFTTEFKHRIHAWTWRFLMIAIFLILGMIIGAILW